MEHVRCSAINCAGDGARVSAVSIAVDTVAPTMKDFDWYRYRIDEMAGQGY
jgi:hypothetical protein